MEKVDKEYYIFTIPPDEAELVSLTLLVFTDLQITPIHFSDTTNKSWKIY
ncbi:MAG TPA: hypothetical protein PLU53_09790 [Bacteroidia bacterium]|nr:hypothetical protein [Bacteroidia bacterium]